MRYLIIFLLISTTAYADQGLKISCLNMLSKIGGKFQPEKFSLDIIHFEYFDKELNKYKKIKTEDLVFGNDYFTARLNDHEITFQHILFNGEQKKRMVMTKYDYKDYKFLDHYACDYKISNIE